VGAPHHTARKQDCVVDAKADATPQALRLDTRARLRGGAAVHQGIAALNVRGLGTIVRLQDATGAPVIDFNEVETGCSKPAPARAQSCKTSPPRASLAKSMDQ